MSRDLRGFADELRQDAASLRTIAGDLDARADGLCALAEQQERDAVSRERAKRAAIAASLEAEGRTFHRGGYVCRTLPYVIGEQAEPFPAVLLTKPGQIGP